MIADVQRECLSRRVGSRALAPVGAHSARGSARPSAGDETLNQLQMTSTVATSSFAIFPMLGEQQGADLGFRSE